MKVAEIYKLIGICQGQFNYYKRLSIFDELPDNYKQMEPPGVKEYVEQCQRRLEEYRKGKRNGYGRRVYDWSLPSNIRAHTMDEERGIA